MIQGVGLGLLALIIGPLMALPIVRLIAQHTLAPPDQNALTILAGNPLPVVLGLCWYALVAAGTAIVAMIIAVLRTIGLDVLRLRRESTRSTHRPLWQRLNLDVAAALSTPI